MDKLGFTVIISSFVLHFLCFGTIQSFGVIFTEILDYFQSSKSETSWTSSISDGLMFLMGPIAGVLEKRYGARVLIGAGSLLVTTGLALSSLASKVFHLYFTYGVFLGFGLCFLNVGATVPINLYFTNYRILAYAVASTGVGVGTLSFPLFIRYLLRNYGWRGTFLLVGGVNLQGLIAGQILPVARLKHDSTASNKQTELNSNGLDKSNDEEELKDLIANKVHDDVTMDHIQADKTKVLDNKTQQNKKHRNRCLSGKVWIAVTKFKDEAWELRRNKKYILYNLGIVVSTMVYFIPYVMIPDLAKKRGISSDNAAFLITIMGISGIFSRILTGFAYKLPVKRNVMLNAGLLFSSGTLGLFCTFIRTYDMFIVFSIVFGGIFNAWGMIGTAAQYDMTGRRLYVTGLSLMFLFCAIVGSIGPPIGGLIADVTGSYMGTFYYAGGMFILGSVFIFLTIFFFKTHSKDVTVT